jgi:DNA-binding CsgD family transcriptional regulator
MLLGRDRERHAIEQALADAREGRSRVLALVGEPGIGKSALLDDAATLAAGMRVLRARGVGTEAQIPFAALFELLRPALDSLDALTPRQAAALESALALRPAQAEDRFAVGAATLSLLAAYAEEQPLLVLVDDVQWLDGSSADALLFAVRRLLAEPIAVLLAAREGEPSLLDEARLPTLALAGLDADAAAALVGRAGREVASRLHRETGGNPLALLELARARLPEVPPVGPVPVVTSVARAYAERAAALPERTRTALVLAAATDRGSLALLARAGTRLGVAVADLDPAEESGLVALAGDRVEFRHPLARSAIYAAAPREQRRRVHRVLARELPDADADRRAWHLAAAAAGPDDTASSALAQAATRARERSAYEVASYAFERAAGLAVADGRRGELLHEAAAAAWLSGLGDRAVTLAGESARLVTDDRLAVANEHLRARIALRRGPLADGVASLLAASDRTEPDEAAVMLAEAAEGAFYAADAEAILECGTRARRFAADGKPGRTAFFGSIADGIALVMAGDGGAGAAAIRRATRMLETSVELRADPALVAWAAVGPLFLREADAGHQALDDAVAAARAASAVGVLPHLLTHVGIHDAATDRWVDAQAALGEAIRLARETGQAVVLAAALARFAWLEARLGREADARAHAGEAIALARGKGAPLCEVWALAALAELELVGDRLEQALAHVEEHRSAVERLRIADADLSPAPERVEILVRLGRRAEAEEVAASFAAAAAAKGQPWSLARAERARALVADDTGYEARFEAALALHARTADVFARARTELAYGARLRRAGLRQRAREHLRSAIEAFDALAAAPWAELASRELAATGETARRRVAGGLGELTPQELQIAVLLAAGRTTREAAAALFLSPKTIEYHLRNVYRKLAVHSREELRQALETRHGAPVPQRDESSGQGDQT